MLTISSEKMQKQYICKSCDFITNNQYNYNKHLLTKKHEMNINSLDKNTNDYHCKICAYATCSQKDYNKHCLTAKHQSLSFDNKILPIFECNHCNRIYKSRVGLWNHKKKCISKNEKETSIIDKLITENNELKNFMIEQSKETNCLMNKIVEITQKQMELPLNIMNNNNTQNNNININMFLNDKCKDAITLNDFIDNVKITNADLENNANLGFVGGISKILLDNLKTLSIFERPIHCTDVKRETMYIKDSDQWSKEEDDKKMRISIQEISRKLMVQFCKWKEEFPDYIDLDSELGAKYIAITQNTIAGNKREQYYNKVVKAVAKETTIHKNDLIE